MRFLECIVAAVQPAEGSFLAQMHQQHPKPRAWSELEFALQCGSIHGAGWVKQRVPVSYTHLNLPNIYSV